ncbi:M48 family metallopeptidase [Paracoccaceae bacterium]|nr:M48 family metallopeptidase [Paracoccaceae bacterium]
MTFDFPLEIIRANRSKSVTIKIEDENIKVIVPENLSDKRIEDLIKKRSTRIKQKIKIYNETVRPKPKEYVNGESFTYMGRNYRLKIILKKEKEVKLKDGYLNTYINKTVSKNNMEETVKKSLENWYQIKALEKLTEKTKRYASILGVTPKSVTVKEYKSRWGSCSSDGDISFNWRIIIAPHQIVDYIVVHELCHILEHNHSPKYWRHIKNVIPNHKECREWLKLNSAALVV